MNTTECPKCFSKHAWLSRTQYDLVLRCTCGLHKILFTTMENAVIEHNDTGGDVKLPKTGSNLRKTLTVLVGRDVATSAEIMQELQGQGEEFDMSDTSTYLTILRSKGLVYRTVVRRSVVGGSTWALTDAAKDLLGV